ncbi:MAG: ABC transporter permease subunit [Alphaproteobacteria bacterium]|nr:MAG: ABC transporter permease subunit [Alphaproteobacteria bacterium]
MGALVAGLWLLGLWSDAMRSAALVTVAVVAAVAIGLPLGIAGARYRRFGQAARVVYDLMQTVPSFVYLIPAAMLLGLGTAPALLATVVVAVPPVARLTDLGLRSVRVEERDAALALGLSDRLMLLLVELPLARPSIMAGVNQAVMGALGMVVIASMIGARGLGETVLIGLQRADAGQGAVGGLGIVLLAILVDRLTQAAGRPHWITAAKPREG